MRLSETQKHELDVIDAVVKGGGESRPDDAALVDFGLLVRSARPLPTAVESDAIDERVRKLGAPKQRRSVSSIGNQAMATGAAFLLVGICVVAGLGGVLDSGSDDKATPDSAPAAAVESTENQSASGSKAATSESVEEFTRDSQKAAVGGDEGGTPAMTPVMPGPGGNERSVASNTSLVLSTGGSEIEKVSDRIVGITDQVGGYVETSEVIAAGEDGRADFLLMIPTARYDAAMASLSKLAHVRQRQQSSQDITGEVKTSNKRLARAKTRVAKLENQLGRATTDVERAELRRKLAGARRSVVNAQRSVARNAARVNYVPVSVALEASNSSAELGKGMLTRAVDTSWSALQLIAAVLLVAVAVITPFAILIAAGWFGLRWRRRRSTERVLSASAQPQVQSE